MWRHSRRVRHCCKYTQEATHRKSMLSLWLNERNKHRFRIMLFDIRFFSQQALEANNVKELWLLMYLYLFLSKSLENWVAHWRVHLIDWVTIVNLESELILNTMKILFAHLLDISILVLASASISTRCSLWKSEVFLRLRQNCHQFYSTIWCAVLNDLAFSLLSSSRILYDCDRKSVKTEYQRKVCKDNDNRISSIRNQSLEAQFLKIRLKENVVSLRLELFSFFVSIEE